MKLSSKQIVSKERVISRPTFTNHTNKKKKGIYELVKVKKEERKKGMRRQQHCQQLFI